MTNISDLPMLHNIDPITLQVRQARTDHPLQDRVRRPHAPGRAARLRLGHHVRRLTPRVAYAALAILAANRYVGRRTGFRSFRVTYASQLV